MTYLLCAAADGQSWWSPPASLSGLYDLVSAERRARARGLVAADRQASVTHRRVTHGRPLGGPLGGPGDDTAIREASRRLTHSLIHPPTPLTQAPCVPKSMRSKCRGPCRWNRDEKRLVILAHWGAFERASRTSSIRHKTTPSVPRQCIPQQPNVRAATGAGTSGPGKRSPARGHQLWPSSRRAAPTCPGHSPASRARRVHGSDKGKWLRGPAPPGEEARARRCVASANRLLQSRPVLPKDGAVKLGSRKQPRPKWP